MKTSDMQAKRDRHQRFWQPLTKNEGGYLGITSPISDDQPPPVTVRAPDSLEEKWLSADYRVHRTEADAANMFWGGDAIHNVFVNFGPGVHAALLGAPYALKEDSIWFDLHPPIEKWDPIPDWKTDESHPLYQAIIEQTSTLCQASKGRYTVSYTDIGGQYDVLFSLRGEALLTDMLECPETVKRAEKRLDDEFLAFFDQLTDLIGPSGCGFSGWIPMVHDKPWYPLQCDLSVMISPDMFESFVLPSLDYVSTAIGQSIYHLDGPEEIRHLEMILSLPHIHAIQWVPLPRTDLSRGGQMVQRFDDQLSIELYRKTLAAGKKIVLLGVRPEQVSPIFEQAGSDGIYVQTFSDTRKDADLLLETAQRKWLKL